MDPSFNEVWKRINAVQPANEVNQLLEFLSEEHESAKEYRRLASCTGSVRAKKLFLSLSEEEKEHAKRLQTAAYMLKGVESAAGKNPPTAGCGRMLDAIRKQFNRERKCADAYAEAAAGIRNDQLRRLYSELAMREKEHCATLWELIRAMM